MFPPVIARGHAVMPLERTGKVHHIGEFAVVNDLLDPHVRHDQQFGGADHLLVPDEYRRGKTMHLSEQPSKMTQCGPVLDRQLVEIEIPERILADLVADFPDLIRVFLDT